MSRKYANFANCCRFTRNSRDVDESSVIWNIYDENNVARVTMEINRINCSEKTRKKYVHDEEKKFIRVLLIPGKTQDPFSLNSNNKLIGSPP